MKRLAFPFRCSTFVSMLLTGLLVTGCSLSTHQFTPEELSYTPLKFPDKTKVIGIVSDTNLNRGHLMDGFDAEGLRIPPLYPELKQLNLDENEIDTGCVTLVIHSMYWNNSYSAPHISNGLKWVIVPGHIHLKEGDIVEIEIIDGIGYVSQKKYEADNHECKMTAYDKNFLLDSIDALFMLSGGAGGGNSASLICPELEAEGWKKITTGRYNEFMWLKQQN